jgi:hypothetical protein
MIYAALTGIKYPTKVVLEYAAEGEQRRVV